MKKFLLSLAVFLFCTIAGTAAPTLGGPTSPDGKVKVKIDFPQRLRLHNTGGIDGSGLCVFTSVAHSARWQLEPSLIDFQAKMKKEPGGGWPQKLDRMIAKYAPAVDYIQFEGRDKTILAAALAGSRLPGVTYNGRDPHYKSFISHMVNLVHLDDRWACILDNNFIGAEDLVWMTPAEFHDRWCGRGSGWAVVLLKEPPDPPVQAERKFEPSAIEQVEDCEPWTYTWYYHQTDKNRVYLYCEDDREPTGAYDLKDNYFRYYDIENGKWLTKCTPPFPPPSIQVGQDSGPVQTIKDYGVPLNQFPPRQQSDERWTRNGKAANRDDILNILQPKPKPMPPPAPPVPPQPQPAPQPVPIVPNPPAPNPSPLPPEPGPAPEPAPQQEGGPALLATLLMAIALTVNTLSKGKKA